MDFEVWFRWFVGGLFAIFGSVTGYLVKALSDADKRTDDLSTRVTVMEQRPQVDPVQHAAAMANLTSAVANLTSTVSNNAIQTQKQHEELARKIDTLTDRVADVSNKIKN